MGAILLTALVQAFVFYKVVGDWSFISPFLMGFWTVIAILFVNAIGMTWHWIPSKFGPAIQAGSWYSLGTFLALIPLGLVAFSYEQFITAYLGILLLAVAILNGLMMYLKKQKQMV